MSEHIVLNPITGKNQATLILADDEQSFLDPVTGKKTGVISADTPIPHADFSSVTAKEGDVLAGKHFIDSDGELVEGNIGAASITKSGNVVTITAGHVSQQETETVGEAIPAATITPTTTDQVIPAGKYTAGEQTIKGDVNLIAENVKKDVVLFGIVGTHEGGSSAAHYKCASVTPASPGTATESRVVLSGFSPAIDGDDYIIVDDTQTGTNRVWYSATTGYSIKDFLGMYAIYLGEDLVEGPTGSTGAETGPWDAPFETGTITKYTSAATPASWSGYLAAVDDHTGIWSFAATATTGLSYDRITPVVGKVYDEDCTYEVVNYNSGDRVPPGWSKQDLVFYAELEDDGIDTIGAANIDFAGGSFGPVGGEKCLKLEGNSYFEWDSSEIDAGNGKPISFFFMMYLNDNKNVNYGGLFGSAADSNSGLMLYSNNYRQTCTIIGSGGTGMENAYAVPTGTWNTYCMTVDSNGQYHVYRDGVSLSGNINTGTVPTASKVVIGYNPFNSGNYLSGGISHFAVYNRELSAAEVLAMHQALMPAAE